jgi:hypothetical protein
VHPDCNAITLNLWLGLTARPKPCKAPTGLRGHHPIGNLQWLNVNQGRASDSSSFLGGTVRAITSASHLTAWTGSVKASQVDSPAQAMPCAMRVSRASPRTNSPILLLATPSKKPVSSVTQHLTVHQTPCVGMVLGKTSTGK